MSKQDKPDKWNGQGKQKTALAGSIAGALFLIAGGLLLLLRPDFGSAAVGTVVGWVLIIAGAVSIAVSILSWPVCGVPEILVCVAACGLGIYLAVNPLMLATVVGIVLGLILLANGISGITESVRLSRRGRNFSATLVLAILTVALGMVLIFTPMTTSRVLMRILGAAMMVCGVVRLVIRARVSRYLDRDDPAAGDPNIIDAEE